VLNTQEAIFAQTFKDKRCKYGRMLATLFGPDGLNINDLLVKHGHARRVAMFCERYD
jgi:endonuclease YncB( thermonuclease family)